MSVSSSNPRTIRATTPGRGMRIRGLGGAAPMAAGVVLLFGIAVLAPLLAPYDPLATSASVLTPPSREHWFGTDAIGRDIFSRVLVATRLDLGIAASAVSVAFVVGTALGALAGYFQGWADRIIGRAADTIMAFPLFVLAMGIVAALGNSVENIVYATIIINLPFYIRFARGEVSARRAITYVEAARVSGNGAGVAGRAQEAWLAVKRIPRTIASPSRGSAVPLRRCLDFALCPAPNR